MTWAVDGLDDSIREVILTAVAAALHKAMEARQDEVKQMASAALDRGLFEIQGRIDVAAGSAVERAVDRALCAAADEAIVKISGGLVDLLADKLTDALRRRSAELRRKET